MRKIKEIWKAVPSATSYEVSNLGRVRSLDRVVTSKNGIKKRLKGRMLSPALSVGYPSVQLGRGNIVKVHILVAEAFLGPRPEGMYVCHNNSDRTDARLSNLRYDTPQNNQRDRRAAGTLTNGEKHPAAKLCQSSVSVIRECLNQGHLQADLAEKFGVSPSTISNIKRNKVWTDGED